MKVLALTLGFDERFAVRAMMRGGISSGDRIVVFMAEPVEERASRCLQVVREFLSRYVRDVEFRVLKVDVGRFEEAVSRIRRGLQEAVRGAEEVVLNLSGGMRALILEVLSAALLLGLDCMVEVELENLTGVVSFPIRLLRASKLSRGDLEILSRLLKTGGWVSLSELSRVSKMPRSTVHKRLRRLIEIGLVESKRVGRRVIYRASEWAGVYI